jgi:hypothetical protein
MTTGFSGNEWFKDMLTDSLPQVLHSDVSKICVTLRQKGSQVEVELKGLSHGPNG